MEIDLGKITVRKTNESIKKSPTAVVKNSNSRSHVLAVGLEKGSVVVRGDVGDYVGALNNGAKIVIDGKACRFLGNCMTSGEIISNGAGYGAGSYMCGGTLVLKGDAGDFLGQMNKGGAILVDGSAGKEAGLYMLNGEIIVTKDLGELAGNYLIHGTIYFGGTAKSLGSNAKIDKLSQEDVQKLSTCFKKHGIQADAKKFSKLVPKSLRPFYGEEEGVSKPSKPTGDVKKAPPKKDGGKND